MLGAILSNVGALVSRLTSTRAGYLDKLNISGNVANGADYTATRAAKLDNLSANINTLAPASTALSTGTWTTAHANNLATVRKQPQILAEAGGIVGVKITSLSNGSIHLTGAANSTISQDKQFGIRLATAVLSGKTPDTYFDVINISDAGWILAVAGYYGYATGGNFGMKLTVDSNVVCETAYASYAQGNGLIVVGMADSYPIVTSYPIRFESALRVEAKAAYANAGITLAVAYLLD